MYSHKSRSITCMSADCIPLNKNPGLRPIGVSENLGRIIGKLVVSAVKADVILLVGSLQVCAGHEAGCEAAVHAMDLIYKDQNTDVVLLIDTKIAFNSVNKGEFIQNIKIIFPTIAKFV